MGKSSSDGDRIDMAGKQPQFDAFAWLVYQLLREKNLAWIRVGDPDAGNLDDIQYSTRTEIHAFQLKWSTQEPIVRFSYNDLKILLGEVVSSWRSLKVAHANEGKLLYGHIMTNRPTAVADKVPNKETAAGSFTEFFEKVWLPLKANQPIPKDWQAALDDFTGQTGLQGQELTEFIDFLKIDLEFRLPEFDRVTGGGKEKDDLRKLSDMIQRVLTEKGKPVLITYDQIIERLGWHDRFRTTFNHELFVDPATYQPNVGTMAELTEMVEASKGGYVFLEGSPGAGKSSLLTEWAREREEKETVIRYYAFDFTNTASLENAHTRGEAATMYFDLVYQLWEKGYYREATLIYRDIPFLDGVFRRQLEALHANYRSSGRKTLIVIDGLDHVPREYRGLLQSFLSHLPNADAIPEGVIIVLGSQSFELVDLTPSVRLLWERGERTVTMRGLTKEEVFQLIDKSLPTTGLPADVKQRLFELSNGHPLYLSYLLKKIRDTGEFGFLEKEPEFDGQIENYYAAIGDQFQDDTALTDLLGLIARIRGRISTSFIKEWSFPAQVQRSLHKNALHLFDQSGGDWRFFHNSFRQFLVSMTAISPLDGKHDPEQHKAFHHKLANFYAASNVENSWKKIYHLYASGDHSGFLAEITLANFTRQFREFRPSHEITEDIKLGLRLAEDQADPYLLTRLLFSLEQLSSRTRYIDVAEFLREFIDLGMLSVAKGLIREGTRLLVSNNTALRAAKWFYRLDDQLEAKTLLTLGQPGGVSASGIRIKINTITDLKPLIESLSLWVKTAALLLPVEVILPRLQVVHIQHEHVELPEWFSGQWLQRHLLQVAARQYAKTRKWAEVAATVDAFDRAAAPDSDARFDLIYSIAMECHYQGDRAKAAEWFAQLKAAVAHATLDESKTLEYAELYLAVTGDQKTVKELIKEIGQPPIVSDKDLDEHSDLTPFHKRIRINRLLNLTGQHQPINIAVPNDSSARGKEIAEFERMICLIAKLQTDSMQGLYLGPMRSRVLPIIRVYYPDVQKHDLTRMKLEFCAKEYFQYLIRVVSRYGADQINELGSIFVEEFREHPIKWNTKLRRRILVELVENGFDRSVAERELFAMESGLTDEKDVDGRVEECRLQARAWITLGERDRALYWMRKALELSFGIGYRKDYQFNYWNIWLRRINEIEPERAKARIEWLTLQLPKIGEMAEGATLGDASYSILTTAFEYDLKFGEKQMVSMLQQGLIDFDAAMRVCLTAYLKQTATREQFDLLYDCYVNIYLNFETQPVSELLAAILEAAQRLLRRDSYVAFEEILLRDIKVAALEKSQEGYRRKVAEFLIAHSLPLPSALAGIQEDITPSRRSESLMLKNSDYKTISEEEVLEKVTSFDDLRGLVLEEDTLNSRFSWKNVIDKVKGTMTARQIEELVANLPAGDRQWELYSHLSGCALAMGDRDLSVRLADKALALSSSAGWSKWYDGGSRLESFRALEAAEPKAARKKAFAVLVQDIVNKEYYSEMSHSIDEFLPLLIEEVDTRRIWAEIEGYLEQLFGNTSTDDTGEQLESLAPTAPLFSVLWFCCTCPAKMVAIAGKTIIARHLTTNPSLFDALKAIDWAKEENQRVALDILTLAAAGGFSSMHGIGAQLGQSAVSRNIAIRLSAKRLLMNIIAAERIPTARFRPLSPMFQLSLPSRADREHAMAQLQIDEAHLDWLSSITGIPRDGILLRWTHLLNTVPDQTLLSQGFQEKIFEYLKSIDLYYPISTPGSIARTQVQDYLIAEAIDGGAAEEGAFLHSLLDFDYDLEVAIKPIPKPVFVGRLSTSSYPTFDPEWTKNIDQTARFNELQIYWQPHWLVVAEYTLIQHLDWRRAQEIYRMQVSAGAINEKYSDESSFGAIQDCLYTEYNTNDDGPDLPYLVILNKTHFLNTGLLATWIALNPKIARALEWRESREGYFAWEGQDGIKRAESVYWRLGNQYMQNQSEAESGEGWFVVLSDQAIKEVKARYTEGLMIFKRIQRSIAIEGHTIKENMDNQIGNWRED